jgi:uncharacterized protein
MFQVERGANLGVKNHNGANALHRAAHKGDLQTVKLLVERRPNLLLEREVNGVTPLLLAAANPDPQIASFLTQRGAAVNDVDAEGNNCLHVAAAFGNLENVTLFAKHLDVNSKTKKGETC